MNDLTKPAAALLRVLAEAPCPLTSRQVAEAMWPDSPAWKKRTRRHDGHAGAVGGTMPMRAGVMLRRLRERGLVARVDTLTWTVTGTGRAIVANSAEV